MARIILSMRPESSLAGKKSSLGSFSYRQNCPKEICHVAGIILRKFVMGPPLVGSLSYSQNRPKEICHVARIILRKFVM